MNKLIEIKRWLEGKKTYFLATALFAYAIGGYVTKHLTLNEAVDLIFGSGFFASLRAAISKPNDPTVKLQTLKDELPESN